MNHTCQQCGHAFKSDRPQSRFCSMACKGVASRNPLRPCEHCGEMFHPPMGRRTTARFCSKACSGASRRQTVSRVCEQCGTGFAVSPRRSEARFCGRACADAGQSRKDRYECKVCGGEFFWSPSRAKWGEVKYCSLGCRDADPARRDQLLRMQAAQGTGKPTRLEIAGYAVLDGIGVPFQRQAPLFGKFVVDALIPDQRLVVQFDGDYWHGHPDEFPEPDERQRRRMALDRSQDAYLTCSGYRVLRFWETTVHRSPAAVAEAIRCALLEVPTAEVPR